MRKRLWIGAAALVAILVGGAKAIDLTLLGPMRREVKVLRYLQAADARRIEHLEQSIAQLKGFNPSGMTPDKEVLACIASTVTEVKADYDRIGDSFAKCRQGVAAVASSWINDVTDEEVFAFYITALTSRLGAYGPSEETDVRAIARSPMLNCNQTTIFVAETIKHVFPKAYVTEISLSSPHFGAHGLVELDIGDRAILLDGLTGSIYLASLDQVTLGSKSKLLSVDFFEEEDRLVSDLRHALIRNIRLGWLLPEHVASRRVL